MNRNPALKSCAVFCALSLCLFACRTYDHNTPYSKSAVFFDTIISIELYGTDEKSADGMLNECMNICTKYENLFDENIPESDISKINNAKDQTVSVSGDTIALISSALSYCRDTDGLFDITIDPVSDLWDFHEGSYIVPDESLIKEALPLVGYQNISVDDISNTVTVKGNAQIDVGAAAKGYIADRLADYLEDRAISGAIINIGGDLKLLGKKPDGSLFNIGINDPGSDGVIADLYLSGKAVATSGTYERCFEKDGRLYHHILDTSTGYPADTDIRSVTVICDDAVDSDCLCTVCILLGSDKALDLIEKTAGTEAYIVKTDGTILSSEGISSYIRQ